MRMGDRMEETLFLKFLGKDNSTIRVIDFLIDKRLSITRRQKYQKR